MERPCKFINAKDDGTDRLGIQAILSQVYQHTLNDDWFHIKDLVLMLSLQKNVSQCDSSTEILYYRTMAYLGLHAFRHANIKEAHDSLVDLMKTGNFKALLASGLLLGQDTIEKLREMPIKMNVNVELIECVYLVSAMLIDIPYIAVHEFDIRRRMISKSFYQQLKSSDRQTFVGPPDKMREHVVAAAKAMRHGHWAACNGFIINEKMNKKVWDFFYEADEIRAMITRLIKEATLKVYLCAYSRAYDSVSISILGEMFELDESVVHCVISKMIINRELMASVDGPSQMVVMHRSEPSHLQVLALQLTDKISSLVDSNEIKLKTELITELKTQQRTVNVNTRSRRGRRQGNKRKN